MSSSAEYFYFIFIAALVATFPSRTHQIELQGQLKCTETQYFDTTQLTCVDCGTNQQKDETGYGCRCLSGFYNTGTNNSCASCLARGMAALRSQTGCVPCGDGSTLNTEAGDCVCPAHYALRETDEAGNTLPEKQCVQCAENYFVPLDDPYSCVPCPDPLMTAGSENLCRCPEGTHKQVEYYCLPKEEVSKISDDFPAENAAVVDYFDVVETKGGKGRSEAITSSTMSTYFLPSAVLCAREPPDIAACQTLANLCVLQLYNPSSAACKMYNRLADKRKSAVNGNSDWPQRMPWLFYSKPERAITNTDIEEKVVFRDPGGSSVDKLSIYLATFSLNGTFHGYRKLLRQLRVCPEDQDVAIEYLRVAHNVIDSCFLDLSQLFVGLLPNTTLPVEYDPATLFYELWLQDAGDHGNLRPLPVRIVNYRDERGNKPNVNIDDWLEEEIANDVLVRRFFVFDMDSGKTAANSVPEIIRFPIAISLKIRVQDDDKELIYPPVLNIEYSERRTQDIDLTKIEDTLAASKQTVKTPAVTFSATYISDQQGLMTALTVLLTVGFILLSFAWIARTAFWMRRNQRQVATTGITCDVFVRAFLFLLDLSSYLLFWIVVIISAFWLIFFKGQATVFVLLPLEDTQMKWFLGMTIAAFFARLLYCLFLMFQQSGIDIFFIDWEKSKGKLLMQAGGVADKPLPPVATDDQSSAALKYSLRRSQMRSSQGMPPPTSASSIPEMRAPVSVWRSLFVANEWNELQTHRTVNITLTLIALAVLLEGVGLIYLATPQPSGTDLRPGPTHPLLRFAITVLLWLALALVQAIVKVLIYYPYVVDKLTQLVDLASVANVSIFVFFEECYGFYIHGQSVHSFADTNMLGMINNLKREEDNLCGTRGLRPETDEQVFEFYCTRQLRDQYTRIFSTMLQSDLDARKIQRTGVWSSTLNSCFPKYTKVPGENLVRAYIILNKFFASFINHTNQQHKYQVGEKNLFQKIFGYPPDLSFIQQTVFYPLRTRGYAKVFLYGIEFQLLTLEILFYCLVDMGAQNTLVAVIVTYLFDAILVWLRQSMGQGNLVRKALVDARFLL